MDLKEKIKSFIKENLTQLIISLVLSIIVIALLLLGIETFSLILIVYLPVIFLIMILGAPLRILSIILILIYSYGLIHLIFVIFKRLKKIRILIAIILILLLLFFSSADEVIINKTINSIDYSCSSDSDCVVKSFSSDRCSNFVCLNKDCNYYTALNKKIYRMKSLAQTQCMQPLNLCSCVENSCQTKKIDESTNLEDCELIDDPYKKEWCVDRISYNINNSINKKEDNDNNTNIIKMNLKKII